MVSKHRTDNDPIKNNFKTKKKNSQIFLALHAALQKKKKRKASGYVERAGEYDSIVTCQCPV